MRLIVNVRGKGRTNCDRLVSTALPARRSGQVRMRLPEKIVARRTDHPGRPSPRHGVPPHALTKPATAAGHKPATPHRRPGSIEISPQR
jgi:hypothetical protein